MQQILTILLPDEAQLDTISLVEPAHSSILEKENLELPPLLSHSHSVLYHLHTLILFTYDQFFDTIIPGTVFGLLTTLSGSALSLPSQTPLAALLRAPIILLWLWLIILQFCLQNQSSDGSWEEDAINKPWRPIPSGRVTVEGAKKLLTWTYLIAGLASWYLNVSSPYLVWTALGLLYNSFGGSDGSGAVRNLFCACFFTCSFGGALHIALGDGVMSKAALHWTFVVCWCVLMTTIQTQEFRDEEGDRQRGRRTLVTELGRNWALWTVYLTITFWTLYVFFPFFSFTG